MGQIVPEFEPLIQFFNPYKAGHFDFWIADYPDAVPLHLRIAKHNRVCGTNPPEEVSPGDSNEGTR
jgi:hypothetical protein